MEMPLEREQPVTPEVEESPFGSDEQLLEIFKKAKKESFADRWLWERKWMRNIHCANNRMWIEYVRKTNEWRDVRLAEWVPKPVTPLIKNGVQALRSMFAAVDIGVNVRPNGSDPKNVAVAAIADDYAPVLHKLHKMEEVFNEADYWYIVTGNVFLHTYLERDMKHGYDEITYEQCGECGEIYGPDQTVEMNGQCPCGAMTPLAPAPEGTLDPMTGKPLETMIARGVGVTIALSPFEMAFPSTYARFDDVPYIIRLRWRTRDYYENHPTLKNQVASFKWAKTPSENSMQLFRSLPYHGDMNVGPWLQSAGSGEEEGAPEYEIAFRPCNEYPDGLVFRVLGDQNPVVLHLEDEEAIPGKLPYVDAEGKALFTYAHAGFEQVGGRVWADGPLDAAIPKNMTLNQHDSFGLMHTNRMANPLWLVPKGSEIEKFTGQPGLVVRWNPLTVGGNAKPERVDGIALPAAHFQLREQYVKDVEEALGTSDVLKGTKPAGVEAFAALQLLVERGQSRFASAFKARGRLYAEWFKWALEIEREFGPDERTNWVMSPARGWAMETFKNADLQGSFGVLVEEGSQSPKTALGMRAAIQHLRTLGFIDPMDPDQKQAVFESFGLSKLVPSQSIHVQAALRKQELFETWAQDPMAQQQSVMQGQQAFAEYEQKLQTVAPPAAPAQPQVDPASGQPMPADPGQEQMQMEAALPPPPSPTEFTPLKWKSWYEAGVHRQEFMKWVNSDKMFTLLQEQPQLEPLLEAHQQEMEQALMMQMGLMAGPAPGGAPGAGQAMANSNSEAGGTGAMPGEPGAAQEAS